MKAAFLFLVISAATLTYSVADAAPQSAELARLILQALEMNKANEAHVEQSKVDALESAVSRVQEKEGGGDQKPANNPYKDFKPPADHKLPSNGEKALQGAIAKEQQLPYPPPPPPIFPPPPPVFPGPPPAFPPPVVPPPVFPPPAFPPPVFPPPLPITVSSFGGTKVTVEKVYKPELQGETTISANDGVHDSSRLSLIWMGLYIFTLSMLIAAELY